MLADCLRGALKLKQDFWPREDREPGQFSQKENKWLWGERKNGNNEDDDDVAIICSHSVIGGSVLHHSSYHFSLESGKC